MISFRFHRRVSVPEPNEPGFFFHLSGVRCQVDQRLRWMICSPVRSPSGRTASQWGRGWFSSFFQFHSRPSVPVPAGVSPALQASTHTPLRRNCRAPPRHPPFPPTGMGSAWWRYRLVTKVGVLRLDWITVVLHMLHCLYCGSLAVTVLSIILSAMIRWKEPAVRFYFGFVGFIVEFEALLAHVSLDGRLASMEP